MTSPIQDFLDAVVQHDWDHPEGDALIEERIRKEAIIERDFQDHDNGVDADVDMAALREENNAFRARIAELEVRIAELEKLVGRQEFQLNPTGLTCAGGRYPGPGEVD